MWRALIAVGCAYEIVALYSDLPTLTACMKLMRGNRLGRWAVCGALGAISWHFLVDG